ncbi:MAG: hypothetical protein OK439_02605 [Thaumarchaeota archaeon]|nr:hypothetical protein [Nitrososphaerota archaeon]
MLVSFVFIFILASVAIGFRASNASIPSTRGCHGGGDGGEVTCTTSTDSTTTVVSSSSTESSTSTLTVSTTVSDPTYDPPIVPSQSTCSALNGISYQSLASGTQLTIAFNGNGQMTFTVPSQSFSWNWYWVPANGVDTNTLSQQITNAMWSSGHGQNFSFFVASLNGQTGIVLQTDYALAQACGK